MAKWPVASVDDLCTLLPGGAWDSNNFSDSGGLPLVRIRDVVRGRSDTYFVGDYDPKYLVNDGDVLIGMDGEFNRNVWRGGKALLNQRVCRIRTASESLDDRFLFHFLPNALKAIENETPFVTVKHLSMPKLRAINIPIPPIEEQRQIAAVLDKADELRDKRRMGLEALDKLTTSIFAEMFGDPATNTLGWPVTEFGDEVSDIHYGTGSPPDYVDNGTPFVRATNIKRGTIIERDLRCIGAADADRLSKCRLAKGNMIVVRSGVNTGDCAVVPAAYEGACAGFDMIVRSSEPDGIFFNCLFNSRYGEQVLEPMSRRAAQPHLNARQLRSLPVISPPPALRGEFASHVARIDRLREDNQKSLEQTDALFASVQQRAFHGTL